ncbi:response regulator [Frankia sp. CNm7]|uniref:histidine kinase n=1 Tax=Frankia nepalensis TaxID=1836974 RepID=A0A937USX8_9ACTN|nr:ATP-binding protein [Frankia nepalensis]MBL7497951.1 response regulator [Frankia nepalensis]MBL7512179.1 response regulator [Frankia nepalensis]MBL7521446.1 response regulator [Frankia nepalensis]MBL7632987.1 response regulator [Frankia nepalensis]
MSTRTLLDALNDLVVVVGADGRILDVGAAARAFLGDRLARVSFLRELADVVEPSARVPADVVLDALARTGEWRGAAHLLDMAGNPVPFDLTVRADRAGWVAVVAKDTSDRRARAGAERDSRAKDEFMARLGHELRTPLNAMLGFAQLLELEPLPPGLMDDVQRIITGGRHMQAIIDDVLDLARLRAGRGDITKAPVNVLDIVEGVVELVEPLAQRRGIRRVIHPAVPLVADADRRRLWQVLLNLLGNAIKYGRDGGTVRVGIVPITGGRLRIEVEDDGQGLPPDAISRLFRPFERLGAEQTRIEGSGLGLALSHALVTAMGGVLTAASRYGVGSVFAVVLDAVDVRYPHPDPDQDPFPPGIGGRIPTDASLRVVHVSGDPATRAQVSQTLARAFAADTVSVPRGALALDAIARSGPDLIMIDQNLPDTTAADLLAHLAGDPAAARVPTVVLSAADDPVEVLRLRQAGARDVVSSPMDTGALVIAVTSAAGASPTDSAVAPTPAAQYPAGSQFPG